MMALGQSGAATKIYQLKPTENFNYDQLSTLALQCHACNYWPISNLFLG